MLRVLLSPLARQDLKDIAHAEYSRAVRQGMHGLGFLFLRFAANEFTQYAALPRMGEACLDLDDDVWRFTLQAYPHPYLVFYRRVAGGIEVLRVLEESRDVPAVLRKG
jgi:plasmid stabilization system protein ParE